MATEATYHIAIQKHSLTVIWIPSDSLNLCITKTCLGMDAKTREIQTEKFVQKTGLLSLAGDKHELGHKLKLFLERDNLRKVRIKA